MNEKSVETIYSELNEATKHVKCRRCGCMREALASLNALLSKDQENKYPDLSDNMKVWDNLQEPVKYSCLGCEHCFAATITNAVSQINPETELLDCDFEVLGWEASYSGGN